MRALLYSFVLVLFICSCNNKNEIITVDLCKEYPSLDIKLSDLAEVSFIVLGGRDSVNFLTDLNELSGDICIDGDLIIIEIVCPVIGILIQNALMKYIYLILVDTLLQVLGMVIKRPMQCHLLKICVYFQVRI